MTKSISILFAIVTLLTACNIKNNATNGATVYSADVLASLAQYTASYNKIRTAVEFESGGKAETCDAYARLAKQFTLKEDIAVQLAKSEYLICDVLAIIGNKKVSAGNKAADLGKVLATRLDLRSYPSSLFQMLDNNKYTLVQLDPNAVKASSTTASYETAEWHYRLELVATFDLDNNGNPDWILWLSDESKSGNYRNYQTLIAHDVKDSGTISAVPYSYTLNTQ